MKKIYSVFPVFLLCLLIPIQLKGQSLDWVVNLGGNKSDQPHAIARDKEGNIFLTGEFSGKVGFGQNLKKKQDNKNSKGLSDIFLTKMSETGEYQWTKTFGGKEKDWGTAVQVDSKGNIYLVMYFQSTVDFGEDFGQSEVRKSMGGGDIAIIRILANGKLDWVRRIGGAGEDRADCLVLDDEGNLYIAGHFQRKVNFKKDFDKSPDSKTGGKSLRNLFISKMTTEGEYLWTRTVTGQNPLGYFETKDLIYDVGGSLYLTGYFLGEADFGKDFGEEYSLRTGTGNHAMFVSRIYEDGSLAWVKKLSGWQSEGRSLATDSRGDLYVAGTFEGQIDFGRSLGNRKELKGIRTNPSSQTFLTKINEDGTYGWTHAWASETAWTEATELMTDELDFLYVAGHFSKSVDFQADFEGGSDQKSAKGQRSLFLTAILPDGSYGWTRMLGGDHELEFSSALEDGGGNMFLTGFFSSQTDMNSDFSGKAKKLKSKGGRDIFAMKVSAYEDLIFPGDVNGDGNANVHDLLPIGLYYDRTGPGRFRPSREWTMQIAKDWGDTLPSGKDIKHIDCNGDGVINWSDRRVILRNYHKWMPREKKKRVRKPLPTFKMELSADSLKPGDTLEILLSLGENQQVKDLYGLAFSIEYPNRLVAGDGVFADFSECWVSEDPSDLITLQKNLNSSGRLDLGVVRTDHLPVTGSGRIALIRMPVSADPLAEDFYQVLDLQLSHIEGINPLGENILLEKAKESVIIGPMPIKKEDSPLRILPNPTTDNLIIESESAKLLSIELLDREQMSLLKMEANYPDKANIEMVSYPKGIYYLSILTDKGLFRQRIILAN